MGDLIAAGSGQQQQHDRLRGDLIFILLDGGDEPLASSSDRKRSRFTSGARLIPAVGFSVTPGIRHLRARLKIWRRTMTTRLVVPEA